MPWWKYEPPTKAGERRTLAGMSLIFTALFGLQWLTLGSSNDQLYFALGWLALAVFQFMLLFSRDRPFRFSMRTLMIAMTVTAVVLGLIGMLLSAMQ